MSKDKIWAFLYFIGLIGFSCLIIYSQLGIRTADPSQPPLPDQLATDTIPIATPPPEADQPLAEEITVDSATEVLTPHISASDISTGLVSLSIPAIELNSRLDLATEIDSADGPTFTQPENNPLWIPDWSTEIGLPGVSMIYGHRQWGPTPKVFTDLDKLLVGDQASIDTPQYQFIYLVTETLIINPEDLWAVADSHNLVAKSDNRNSLMLITCTPWGTNLQRLIIFLRLEAVT